MVVTVRPENVELTRQKRPQWVHALIETLQPTGSETIVQVRAGDLLLTAVKPGFARLEVDQPVWIHIDPSALSFFDPKTGKNLDYVTKCVS